MWKMPKTSSYQHCCKNRTPFARDMIELRMNVEEFENKLRMKHIVYKAMHAKLKRFETEKERLQEEKELVVCTRDQMRQQPVKKEGVEESKARSWCRVAGTDFWKSAKSR